MHTVRVIVSVAVLIALFGASAPSAQEAQARIAEALSNITTLRRTGQDGLATFWDGNKFAQCRRMPDQAMLCEAAGTLMQPSLARILTPERLGRLGELGWRLDPSFGNHVQTFPAGMPAGDIAERLLEALHDAYAADIANLKIRTDWVRAESCPPRNGPSQNLAGMINDHPAMAATAVRGCAYVPVEQASLIRSKAELLGAYGPKMSAEIQRLRINMDDRVFLIVDTGGGYVQCRPDPTSRVIYCEAQSAESWPVLSRILTPERLARLRAAGFAEPGRAPNYWKTYATASPDDRAIAEELLTILFDVYGYNGTPKLQFKTEKGPA